MKLLYLSKYALNENYGVPTRQYFYCKYLSRIPGNSVWLISSRSTTAPNIPAFRGISIDDSFGTLTNTILNGPNINLGMNFTRVFSWFWFEIQVWRLFSRIRKWKPDVIFVSSMSLLTFITGVLLKWLLRKPLVLEVRDIHPLTLIELGGFSRYHPAIMFFSAVEKFGYKNADLIIGTMPNLREHVESVVGHEKEVIHMPMGLDDDFYSKNTPLSKQGEESVKLLDSLTGKFLVGYAGTIGRANSLHASLEAIRELELENANIALVLIGDGPLLAKYRNEYRDVKSICFLGAHPKNDVSKLLSKVSVVINPWQKSRLYRYGISPNKWIDYFQASKPILVCYSGYIESPIEGEFGWQVPPDDSSAIKQKLLEISKLPSSELETLGNAGHKKLLESLSYNVLAPRLNQYLNDLIS